MSYEAQMFNTAEQKQLTENHSSATATVQVNEKLLLKPNYINKGINGWDLLIRRGCLSQITHDFSYLLTSLLRISVVAYVKQTLSLEHDCFPNFR